MTPSYPTPLDAARSAWLDGDRNAWSLYTLCIAQLRALDEDRVSRPPTIRPRPSLRTDRPVPVSRPPV